MAKEPVHISSPNTEQKSRREQELESINEQWQEAYTKLQEKETINSLGDDKIFRAELLSSINNLAGLFKNFLDKLEQAQN